MARRVKPTRAMRCAEGNGCAEYGLFKFDNRSQLRDHYNTVREWRCVRHSNKEEVLSLSNLKAIWESRPSGKSERFPELTNLYWGNSGLLHGNGYKAFADDFPAGTVIRVTAEVLLPEGEVAA